MGWWASMGARGQLEGCRVAQVRWAWTEMVVVAAKKH